MKNICLKTLTIILITIIMVFAFQIKTSEATVSQMITDADKFFDEGKNGSKEIINNPSAIKSTASTIYNVLLSVCIVAALIVGIFIGIKFMTGSAEDQAKVKETLIPYTVGCAIAFGAFGIWKIVMEIINIVA